MTQFGWDLPPGVTDNMLRCICIKKTSGTHLPELQTYHKGGIGMKLRMQKADYAWLGVTIIQTLIAIGIINIM